MLKSSLIYRSLKTLLLLVLSLLYGLGISYFPETKALLTSSVTASGIVGTSEDWTPPAPTLVSPANGTIAGTNSPWTLNPLMDWENVSWGTSITYIYQSSHSNAVNPDGSFVSPAYTSVPLVASQIPAPGTPDGIYFWHVKACDAVSGCGDWSEMWLLTVDRTIQETNPGGVILNEILPDPTGSDISSMPDGEWVELFNTSTDDINVAGWSLYDAIDTHRLPITSSNTNTGNTIVPAHGFLVVYRNGDTDFSLNDDAAGDTIRLYSGTISTGVLVDSHAYIGPVLENKSIARIPDGTGPWVDPIPTPGAPNQLESLSPVTTTTIEEQATPPAEPLLLVNSLLPLPPLELSPNLGIMPLPSPESALTHLPTSTPLPASTPEPGATPLPTDAPVFTPAPDSIPEPLMTPILETTSIPINE